MWGFIDVNKPTIPENKLHANLYDRSLVFIDTFYGFRKRIHLVKNFTRKSPFIVFSRAQGRSSALIPYK